MNIESDTLRYDDTKQTSVFTGKVVLTKGTIQIRSERLEVRQDPDGYQFGQATGSADKLASYRQKREALDEFIEGEGQLLLVQHTLLLFVYWRRRSAIVMLSMSVALFQRDFYQH